MARKARDPHYQLLKDKLSNREYIREDICALLGKTDGYVAPRMTGKRPFSIDDVYKLLDAAEVEYKDSEIYKYFPPGGLHSKKKAKPKVFKLVKEA